MNVQGWVAIALMLWFPFAFCLAATSAGKRGGCPDRRSMVTGFAEAGLGLGIGHALVPWDIVPPTLWAVPATVTAWGVIAAARNWPTLPTIVGSRPWLRIAGAVLWAAVCGALVVSLTGMA